MEQHLSQRAERGLTTAHPQLIDHSSSDKYFWACCITGAREAQAPVRARGVVGICCLHSPSADVILDDKGNDHLKFSCMCQPKTGTLKSLASHVPRAAKWVLSAAPVPSLPRLGSLFILSFKPHLLMNSNLYCLCHVASFWTWQHELRWVICITARDKINYNNNKWSNLKRISVNPSSLMANLCKPRLYGSWRNKC